jgi:arylsulfatase A-like enzyme
MSPARQGKAARGSRPVPGERPGPGTTAAPGRRPNILVVIADQLRADHLGFAGNAEVNTPHLDHLADRSAVFERAFVANPTCMPNRASLITGRWPSAHGTRCNGIALEPDASTFVRSLAREGYRTAAVGKLHHQNMGWDFEPEQRGQIRDTAPGLLDGAWPDARARGRAPGWDQWENRARHDAADVALPPDYYGYDEVDLVIGHGDAPGGHWRHWALARGVDPDALGGPAASPEPVRGWDQVYTSAIPASAHPTRYIGERAEARIRDAAGKEEPFFLFVSFPDPHHPFAPPAEYAQRHDPAALSLPRGFDQDHGSSPTHIQKMVAARGTPNQDPTMSFAVTEEQYRAAAAAQYGLIEFMDEQIGRILGALEETGQAEDTVVVFTADHGDLFGDHGLMLKHFVHYEAVTRVPLLLHLPANAAPRRIPALVSTTDLAPTFLDLAGAGHFNGIQGTSLLPLLDGTRHTLHDALLIEEDQPFSLEGLPAPVRMRSVVTDQGRLTRYFGADEAELYDHRSDPDELRNIMGEPEAAELEAALGLALLEAMARVCDTGIAPTAAA